MDYGCILHDDCCMEGSDATAFTRRQRKHVKRCGLSNRLLPENFNGNAFVAVHLFLSPSHHGAWSDSTAEQRKVAKC